MINRELVAILERSVDDDSFVSVAYDVTERISLEKNSIEYMDILFNFIETHPTSYLGDPGPIVHFLEKYAEKGYEEKLINSVEKHPVYYNIYMMGRAINDATDKRHNVYINIFKNLLSSNQIDNDLKEFVKDFIS